MKQELHIVYFTSREGGVMREWRNGAVPEFELHIACCNAAKGSTEIWLRRTLVHALFLSDGRGWDAINKWRADFDWRDYQQQKTYCCWCNYEINNHLDSCENCSASGGEVPWICTCDKEPMWNWDNKQRRWTCAGCGIEVDIAK